jgi:hypothetical protein
MKKQNNSTTGNGREPKTTRGRKKLNIEDWGSNTLNIED